MKLYKNNVITIAQLHATISHAFSPRHLQCSENWAQDETWLPVEEPITLLTNVPEKILPLIRPSLGGKYLQQSTSSKVKLNQVPTEWRTAGLLADKFHSRRAGTSTPWNSYKTWQTNDGISINWRHHPEGHSREAKEQTMIFRGRTKAPTGKGKLLATSK